MAYIGTSPSNGVRRRFVYEATASQTSFSGSDENGVTLTYVDSLYLDVFQNGIKLKAGDDYTATTGTSVVLVQGASANDVVEMVAFDIFSVGDTVSAKDGGSFAGNVAMAGTLGVTGVPTFTGRSVHSGGITVANDGQIGSVGDADAIAIASGGVVTFSQNTVGAGGMDLILSDTISSSVAQYDISSTYINSTYDEYKLFYGLSIENDNANIYSRVFVGGTIQTGSIYAYQTDLMSGTSASSSAAAAFFDMHTNGLGAATGEQLFGNITLHNVNNDRAFNYTGMTNYYASDATHRADAIGGSLIHANRTNVVNGFRLYPQSGNIILGTIKLFGIRK
jgi:hypothetical protein